MEITVAGRQIILADRDDYKDFLAREGVKCLMIDEKEIGFGSLEDGGTYTLGPLIQSSVGKRPAADAPTLIKKRRALVSYELIDGNVTEFPIDSTRLLNPTATKTIRYFSRDGVSELLDELMDDQKGQRYYNIALIGNPGSGKSNLAYAAAECLASRHKGKPVLWVGRRYRGQTWNVRFFWPSRGETSAYVEILEDRFENLEDVLRLEKALHVQVLILDAPTRSDDDSAVDGAAAFRWAGGTERKSNRRVIHVSSLGAFAHKQTVRDECGLRERQMRIWTRNDFVRSLDDVLLKQQLCNTLADQDVHEFTNEELVDKKFFFSGINARWFFNASIDQIKKECSEIVERLGQGSTNAGMKTKQAINSFQATINTAERSIKVFTSPYLAQCAGAKSSYQHQFLALFPLVKNYLGNGAPGEIFECDFAMHLQHSHDLADAQVAVMGNRAQQINVNLGVAEGGNRLEWPTGVLRTLPKAKNDEIVPQSTGLKASALKRVPQWFIPEDKSQAFLDFMVLVPLETGTRWQLKIIQSTVGKRHSSDTPKLQRIVLGVLDDGFALDSDIVLAYVIEDRAKSGNVANHLDGGNLSVVYSNSRHVFTLKVFHPVYTRTTV